MYYLAPLSGFPSRASAGFICERIVAHRFAQSDDLGAHNLWNCDRASSLLRHFIE